MAKPHRLIPVLALAALVGCDDGTTPAQEDPGSFTASVSGDYTASLQGVAQFGEATDPDTGDPGWVLWLSTDDSGSEFHALWFVRLDERPGTGSYDLEDLDAGSLDTGELGAFLSGQGGGATVSVYSTGGSLVIASSSGDRVEGTFTVQAAGVVAAGDQGTEGAVTITGEFEAPRGTVSFPGI